MNHLLQRLFLRKQKLFDSTAQQFLSLDRKFLEKQLNLKDQAAKDGRNNIPESDAVTKDAIAAEIDVRLTEILRRGKDQFQEYIHAIYNLNAAHSLDTQITELKASTQKVLNDFYAACRNGINRLVSIKQDITDGELDYEKFRAENNLDRPADYPDSCLGAYLWIAIAALVESVINAIFMGSAHPEGFVGFFGEISVIVVVNLFLFGIPIAYLFRLTHHVNKIKSFIGWAAVLVVSMMAIVFNFFIGHYRDSLMEMQIASGRITKKADYYERFESLFSTTFNHAFSMDTFWKFDGLMSVLLMLAGILMVGIFAFKFFTSDDPYPGYGKKARALKKNMDVYSNTFDDFQKELEEIGDQADKNAKDSFELGQASIDNVRGRKETLNMLVSKYHSWVSELKAIGMALYAAYRQINQEHRTDGSPPAFEIGFSIPDDIAAPPALPKLTKEQDVERLRKWTDTCLAFVNEASNRYLSLYKTIAQLAPENGKMERIGAHDTEVDKINAELKQEWENACLGLDKADG